MPGNHRSRGPRRPCTSLRNLKRQFLTRTYVPDNPGPLLRQRLRYGRPGGVQLPQAREVLVPSEVFHLLRIQKLKSYVCTCRRVR